MIRRMPKRQAGSSSSWAEMAERPSSLPGMPQPVDAALPDLLAHLERGNCAVLSAAPGAGKERKRLRDAEEAGNGLTRTDLHALAQEAERAVHRDGAGMRNEIAGDEFQQRRLADAVPAD